MKLSTFIRKPALTALVLGSIAAVAFPSQLFAQEKLDTPLGIAYQLKVVSAIDVFNGMIVSIGDSAYTESNGTYDRNMYGVIDLSPSIEFTFGNTEDTLPVIADGTAYVAVSGENGPINEGDLITSSSKPGVGMKATKSGFTLGVAEESYAGSTAEEQGLVAIRINKQFTFGDDSPDSETISDRLRNVVSLSAIAAFEEPTKVFKYVVAGIILTIAVLVSFISLGRTSQKGIEAIGRNPLARSSIIASIFGNVVVALFMLVAGVVGAYIMVTL
ncbi:MAG: hypothetical protein GW762_04065 [Candidatus Pacebacteria bacterium]|nr:hypothetical protein [Candidatus Paceibacterota bacterium]PIR63574.1 MAG: hypothetical protein COU64_03915 [Candidatus Pacebacteria bacterium CG10_big_fil_rev_8_21_14_0_10_40_26]PIZ79231.1 MAG: hypothetical protein COY01_02290 [Candidatus Pacebacteria bacterium CG_4_10_14_0_2_um_filter_40_20]PJA68886.1 MAG: hypothetical protein CO156_02895 [Candidatus Pacebacteria bacterium CG_4_9_14_3_um_filter_40_12]PJC42198.1 MAG: hypothetical protein CO041_01000 [Candidatus Pacebacteria bacterium CG_4_9_